MHLPSPLDDHSRWADADVELRLLPPRKPARGARARDRTQPAETVVASAPVRLVRAGRGAARGRGHRFAQANVRPDRLTPITPSFRLAGPAGRSHDLRRPGVLLSPLVLWGRRGRWLAPRMLCTLTLLPPDLGGLSADFRSGGARSGPGRRGAVGAGARAAAGRLSAAGPDQLSSRRRLSWSLLAASPWGQDRIKEWREAPAAVAAAGQPQRALDRDGHGGRGPPEPLRLRPSHQPDHR